MKIEIVVPCINLYLKYTKPAIDSIIEPAVIAVGGLMQWLLFSTPWLQSSRNNSMFVVEKEEDKDDSN